MGKKKNKYLQNLKIADEETFTTNVGMKIRKYAYKPLKYPVKLATKQKIHIESFPKLEKGVPYIFVSAHSFCEDVNADLVSLDRNAYVLFGSTDQLDYNPGAYGMWANGMIYVNRCDDESKANVLPKMERLINNDVSVLLFPEGGYNNTENLLCEKLFSGFYHLNRKTGAKVVPMVPFFEHGSNNIYLRVEDPMDFSDKTKEEAKTELRGQLGIMMWELIRDHSTHAVRKELPSDCRERFMEERKSEYMKSKWSSEDVWDEELTTYVDMINPTPEQVRATFDDVKITAKNASIFAPVLVKRLEDQKYDFKNYMKKNWDK